jgi:hypothetical protein
MKKTEKIYNVKNLISGEVFTTSTVYEKTIDGIQFIGVWKDSDPHRRINWMRKDSLTKVK